MKKSDDAYKSIGEVAKILNFFIIVIFYIFEFTINKILFFIIFIRIIV